MKRLNEFLAEVLIDLGTLCGVSTIRDLKTVTDRIDHEGLSFLTITLPDFGKDLERALAQGSVSPSLFSSWKKRGGLPLFLGGFLDLVFDRRDGVLLPDPSVDAIWSIRQFTLMFGKIELPCSDARKALAFQKYLEVEEEVRVSDRRLAKDHNLREDFQRIGSLLWARVFSAVDELIAYHGLRPKHGPGATADGIRGNAKWTNLKWTERLESVFPAVDWLATWSTRDRLQHLTYLSPGAETPVKVISVPKTLKTERIIAEEPVHMMYAQQALMDAIVEAIEFPRYADEFDNFISGLVGFRSQEVNNSLAEIGSLTGDLATLDLSEASDRVSNQHVRLLLARHPHLFEAVDAVRSRKADVRGHGVIRLAKFASMGSALTFPMEAIVFSTVVFMGIEKELGHRLTRRDLIDLAGSVRLYGDDIIVPTQFAESVVDALETMGFKVNANKSFWTGKFRESCGKEYYDGEDVSIVRVRQVFPTQRRHAAEIISTVELRNHLYKAGLWRAAGFLDDMLRDLIPWPVVEETSPILGRFSYLRYLTIDDWDHDLQIPLVRGAKVVSNLPSDELDDYGALMKCLLTRCGLPATDNEHLHRAGRPRVVRINTRGKAQPW